VKAADQNRGRRATGARAAINGGTTTDRLRNQRQATPRARIIEDRRGDCNIGYAAEPRESRSAAVVISAREIFPRDLEQPRTQSAVFIPSFDGVSGRGLELWSDRPHSRD
jgi:hypothetical protein